MAVIVKVQAVWQGFQGAPGYSNWYGLSDGDAAAAANALGPRMRTFFNALVAQIPLGATVKVQRLYQVIDGLTGRITSEAPLTADPAVVTGTGNVSYSAATGAVINWETGQFNDKGHRIRGRTYLVPLVAIFDPQGSISPGGQTLLGNAATAALGGTGSLGVWSRPIIPKDSPDGVPTVPGTFRVATVAVVHDKAAVLKSRRD